VRTGLQNVPNRQEEKHIIKSLTNTRYRVMLSFMPAGREELNNCTI
jgi:hypothetical protein